VSRLIQKKFDIVPILNRCTNGKTINLSTFRSLRRVRAEMLNRFKLGRTLDEAYGYGCDRLLSELAMAVCAQQGSDWRFSYLDTTSFAVTGAYACHASELCAQVLVPLSAQEYTSLPCNARSLVFIRMKLRTGWRTWNVGTGNMSATLHPGSTDLGSFQRRDVAAASGIPWIVSTVIKMHTRAPHPGNTLCSHRRAIDIVLHCKPP
jgi:hypothetical protein